MVIGPALVRDFLWTFGLGLAQDLNKWNKKQEQQIHSM
ncbi:hypothetical protein AVEN_100348-1, partial [Araneus ventricosus]